VRTFGRYLWEIFGTGWGILLSIAGAISTCVTFVIIYRPAFGLPHWIPIALSMAFWLFAPYQLYRKQRARIEALEAQQQQRRRAMLVMIEESRSFYIRCFTPPGLLPKRETGMYLELWVSVENKGERAATITRYDLRIEGMGEFLDQRPAPQLYVLGRNAQHALNVSGVVKNYIEVPAERLAQHQHIPFMLDAVPPSDARQIRCELTVTDTEANSASAQLNVTERGP
jgi:hypothetical protein